MPEKYRNLINMCLEKTYCKIKMENRLSDMFELAVGLRQGDHESLMLINLVQEKNDREMEKLNLGGMALGDEKISRLA